ncbi:MAG: hypothetical protein KF757_12440 [Phycisphaeraceae bacterium]|nr:hypothetical protein [Phycisphaeraceae bacterium]MCW5762499.1 hypothetical protein [Phycisphaeraceae bacterium]
MLTCKNISLGVTLGLLMILGGCGSRYEVRDLSDVSPGVLRAAALDALHVEWSAFAVNSICGEYLVLGAHPVGNPDQCEFVVYDLKDDAVISRTPVDCPAEFMDCLSRSICVARIESDGSPTVRVVKAEHGRFWFQAGPAAQFRRLASTKRSQPDWSIACVSDLERRLPSTFKYLENKALPIGPLESDQVVISDIPVALGFDADRQYRFMVPWIRIDDPHQDSGFSRLSISGWQVVGEPVVDLELTRADAHRVSHAYPSQRIARYVRPMYGKFATLSFKKYTKVEILDIQRGKAVYFYELRGRQGFNLSKVHRSFFLGHSPQGNLAFYALKSLSDESQVKMDSDAGWSFGLMAVRLSPPWTMSVVVLPAMAQRIFWTPDGQMYIVLTQPFFNNGTRTGGLATPPIYPLDAWFME